LKTKDINQPGANIGFKIMFLIILKNLYTTNNFCLQILKIL